MGKMTRNEKRKSKLSIFQLKALFVDNKTTERVNTHKKEQSTHLQCGCNNCKSQYLALITT